LRQRQPEEVVILCKCDLCGEVKGRFQRTIEYKEYDICAECWEALAAKLSGKGRARKVREKVLLPHLNPEAPGEQRKRMLD
jgi:hypothetical protein